MATTLSLSSPLFLGAPARARDAVSYGVASASVSRSTVNVLGKGYMRKVHDREQQRRMAIVSVQYMTKAKEMSDDLCITKFKGEHGNFKLISTLHILSSLEGRSRRPEKQLSRTLTIGYQLLYLVSSKVRIASGFAYADNLLAAAPVGLLGLLLLFQTARVRFVFDNEALEVKVGDQLQESGENVFVGGKNRWKYSTFVNWELWWPQFPILVYFKETQTKPEGQIHFFPVIFNGRQLYDVMVERAGPSKTSGPK